MDEREKAQFSRFFWKSLLKVRTERWRADYEEVAVTLHGRAEFAGLPAVMREALASIEGD
jgi:hypothetical protein